MPIHERLADSWSVCSHCECGLDARPIRELDGRLVACCPHDAAEDVVLDEQDLKRFGIDSDRLAAKIAASGGLVGAPAPIADGLWSLGATPGGVAVVLCSDPDRLEAPGTILAIRAAIGGSPGMLVAAVLGPTAKIRLCEAGLAAAQVDDALMADGIGTDRLALERLADSGPTGSSDVASGIASSARLQISRARRILRLDGQDIVLSLSGFDAFTGAAERSSRGGSRRAARRKARGEGSSRPRGTRPCRARLSGWGLRRLVSIRLTAGVAAHSQRACLP